MYTTIYVDIICIKTNEENLIIKKETNKNNMFFNIGIEKLDSSMYSH